jgi:hypothetical protein
MTKLKDIDLPITLQTAAELQFQTLPEVDEPMHPHVLHTYFLRELP